MNLSTKPAKDPGGEPAYPEATHIEAETKPSKRAPSQYLDLTPLGGGITMMITTIVIAHHLLPVGHETNPRLPAPAR